MHNKAPISYSKRPKIHLPPTVVIILLVSIWYVLIGKDILPQAVKNVQSNKKQEIGVQKNYYPFICSEANFTRLIGLTQLSEKESDTSSDEEKNELWYEKYYAQLETLGVTALKKEDAFNPLSGNKFKEVLEELFEGVTLEETLAKKSQLELYEVIETYNQILNTQNQSLTYETLVVLGTPSDELMLESWQLASDKGYYYFEGLVVDPIKNQTLQTAVYNNHLLGIIEIQENSCELEGCKILKVDDGSVTFELEGQSYTYKQNNLLSAANVGSSGTLKIEASQVIGFTIGPSQTVQNQTIGEAIRVVLSSSGNYVQSQVSVTSEADYDMVYEGQASTLEAGSVWESEQFEWKEGQMVKFVPRTDSVLTISSLVKGGQTPSYKGILEVTKTEKGYTLVNEVDLESYIAAVIPSEMPTSYGLEALKAQAVAARTYGAACFTSNKFAAYDAHVDDTTASQVYNQIPANAISYQAASETAGMVLKSNGTLVSNKFFAASCGYTANFGEVWAGENFPGNSPSYLIARQQYLGDSLISDVSQEENFKQFIGLTAEDIDAFDEASPWFRWQVELSGEELKNLMIPALKKLSTQYPTLISYETIEGKKSVAVIEDLGSIQKLKAEERGAGGNLMVLGIYGEKGTVKVSTEYLIRSLFASNDKQGLTVTRSNQTTVKSMSLLPSAFFTIEELQDASGVLQSVTLLGGGNGHGVGLSQDGAKGMAERGYDYKEILAHYYTDCELVGLWS